MYIFLLTCFKKIKLKIELFQSPMARSVTIYICVSVAIVYFVFSWYRFTSNNSCGQFIVTFPTSLAHT